MYDDVDDNNEDMMTYIKIAIVWLYHKIYVHQKNYC